MILKNLCLIVFACALSVGAASSEITDLKFAELLQSPVGDRGFKVSKKAKNLDGKRVRFTGQIAQHHHAPAGTFLLAPIPVQLHDDHYGLADDLPATTVFISTGSRGKKKLYAPGLVTVTGLFSVGNRQEADGRISTFRIALDSPTPKESKAGFFRFLKRHNASRSKDN
jgi:hypothetical protein